MGKSNYEDMTPQNIATQVDKLDAMADVEGTEQIDLGDGQQIKYNADGEIEITMESGDSVVEISIENDFNDNLVETLDYLTLDNISEDLIEKFEQDKVAREKRDKQYEMGMRRAGLDEDASPDGADFEGSSKVVHPMIAENTIDFASREAKELAPPDGLVRSKILGNADARKQDIADRKVSFMNILFQKYMPYINTLEQMLSQLALGGSQFIKFWHDEYLRRPNCEFLPIDKVYFPFSCNDFYTAERVTVCMTMGEVEYWRRVKSGVYFDEEYDVDTTDNASGEVDGNESKTEMTNNVIEGKSRQNPGDLDRNQDLLEIYTFLMIDDDPYSNGEYAPYIVTIKEATNEIVGLYRNWHKDDKRRQKLDYIAKFDFIPWRGAVGIGLGQIIGSLSVGATGALRALLDSAHINNIPTALGMKGLKMAGQSADINVGQITYLEGPASLDGDIRKWMMPLPFNPPSPVLFQLLEWLTNAAGKLIKMPDGGLEQMGDRTPASTSLAIIEQNSMTQSAIHRRLHYSQAKCFDIVSRLLADYFDPEGYPEEIVNDYGVNNKLFLNTADIIPVSDPNIFTEAQRYAQIQALSGLKAQYQGLINDAEVLRRTLKALKIPDPETLMNVPNQVSRANPIAENMTCFLGNSIAVFPEQDHLAHIKIHAKFLQDPAYGANPLFSQGVPALTEHMKQHLLYFYAQTYQTLMDAEKEDTSVNLLAKKHTEQNFDDELLSISDAAEAYMHQQLQEFAPLLQQIMQQQQQAQQAAQAQDPNMAKIALEQQELQQDSQQQQAENQLAQQKLQLEAQEMQQEGALKQQQMELQAKTATMAAVSKHQAMMDEVQISKDRNRADVELEQLRIKIEEIKAMASIKSTNEQFEHSQWSQILKHIEHMDKLSNDMTKHESQLEHDTKIQQAQENAQTVASLGQQ